MTPTNKYTGYQCFHCGCYAVYWGGDFDFEDYGYEGNGIIHECHCFNCGADITYRVAIEEEPDGNDRETEKTEELQ